MTRLKLFPLDKELMRIGRHEHMKQLDETKRELDFAASGPTVSMMFVGEAIEEHEEKEQERAFFSKGGSRGDEIPETPTTFGDSPDEEGKEESKCEDDEEESPKELEVASQNLRVREYWLKKEMSTVGADPKHEKVMDEINQVALEVAKIESRLMDMGKGSQERSDSSERREQERTGGDAQGRDREGRRGCPSGLVRGHLDEECR